MLRLQCLVNFQVETSPCGILNSASVDPQHLRDNMRQFNQYLNTFCSEQSSFQRMRFQFYTCLLGTMLYPEGGTSFIETLFLANWKNVLKLSCRLPCQWPPTPLTEPFSVRERVDSLKKRQAAFLYLKACLNQALILTLLLLWLSFILRPK